MKRKLDLFEYNNNDGVGRLRAITPSQEIAIAEKLEANMMTKAQFNALAEERKANRAGSGFDEWGKHSSVANVTPVNEGIHTWSGASNYFYIGEYNSKFGSSKTFNPYVCINGVLSKVISISSSISNVIKLPTAPNIYPHDTVLTAEQINSGVIKHADASNSGLIVNGKFDTDISGWTGVKSTIASVLGKLRITLTDVDGGAYQFIPTVIGKKYIIELDTTFGTNTDISIRAYTGTFGTLLADKTTTVQGRHTLEFTATASSTMVYVMTRNSTGKYCDFDNIAVYPADAISRSDLVFLENWHEDVSEKNFVYDNGNTQSLSTANIIGVTPTNGNFTGYETYSLFGNWQTQSALIGKGYVWSSLTEAQKRAFIANHENNCYLDGDKTIQVRYRVRVVQGLGDSYFSGGLLYYSDSTGRVYTNNDWLKPKGKLVNITNDLAAYSINETGYYSKINTTFLKSTDYASDYGLLVALAKPDNAFETQTSYNGRNFAILLCSTHRRNQGMYHPVYNANGTKKASDGNFWYNTAVSFTSISDCFDQAKLLAASGYIGSVSGRPDGLFYDQVHEGDITDLRNSSKKVEDYNRLISREFNKLVAGTTRGKEGEFAIIKNNVSITESSQSGINVFMSLSSLGISQAELVQGTVDVLFKFSSLPNSNGSYQIGTWYKVPKSAINTASALLIAPNSITAIATYTAEIIVSKSSTRTKSNTLLHCDIIGNPTNYPTAWKESGVFGTPLIVAEDGTSLLPDGTKDTFKLSRKANATPLLCLRSTDNGATWTSFTPTFSTITNAITLTDEPAGNLVMVYYQTHTSMAVPVVNSEVLEIGDVYAHNYHGESNYLQQSLINKVNTNNNFTATSLFVGKISTYAIYASKLRSVVSDIAIAHSTIGMLQAAQPLVKVFPYLTRTNGKAYLNLVFKEMKYNGTSWGDDNKFNIVDNVSTTIDNNAQTVLIGQKTVELPYFIGADE